MPAEVFEFDRPDRFIVGTVGEPGSRTFYLQAKGRTTDSSLDRVTSVALEKQQVSVLAERVDELLDEVSRRSSDTPSADPRSPVQPAAPTDLDPLELPLEEDFRVGTMSLGWDAERELVVLECFATVESDFTEDTEEPDEPSELDPPPGTDGDRAILRVTLTRQQAKAFVARAEAVVAAGRPPCPFCEGPLDPSGHICPRANGYRR